MSSNSREQQLADYDNLLRLVLLGDSGVGKTSILMRFTEGTFDARLGATVGIDFREKRVNRERQRISLQFWDTAGQERFRGVATSLFRMCMGFFLVFDLTRKETYLNVRDWLTQIKTHAFRDSPHIVLVGNKSDFKGSKRDVTTTEAQEFASKLGLPYIETSAATGANVDDAVFKLVDVILKAIDDSVPTPGHDSLHALVPTPDTDAVLLRDNPVASQSTCSC